MSDNKVIEAHRRFYHYCATGFPPGYWPHEYAADYQTINGKPLKLPFRWRFRRFVRRAIQIVIPEDE